MYSSLISTAKTRRPPATTPFKPHLKTFDEWVARCPSLGVRGGPPGLDAVVEEVGRWWLPRESVLYIGATEEENGLHGRIKKFNSTRVGKNGPHSGGIWVRLVVSPLWLYWAECKDPFGKEKELFVRFKAQAQLPATFPDQAFGLPFANLKDEDERKKRHRLVGTRVKKKRKKRKKRRL